MRIDLEILGLVWKRTEPISHTYKHRQLVVRERAMAVTTGTTLTSSHNHSLQLVQTGTRVSDYQTIG